MQIEKYLFKLSYYYEIIQILRISLLQIICFCHLHLYSRFARQEDSVVFLFTFAHVFLFFWSLFSPQSCLVFPGSVGLGMHFFFALGFLIMFSWYFYLVIYYIILYMRYEFGLRSFQPFPPTFTQLSLVWRTLLYFCYFCS